MTHTQVALSQDAALVLALAGTAMPFARSAEDEAERWLRILRLHGRTGRALQSLGVGEAPLMTLADPTTRETSISALGALGVDEVNKRAHGFAAARRADCVGTADVLFAVFELYGGLFDRVLYARGVSRDELIERLSQADHEPAPLPSAAA